MPFTVCGISSLSGVDLASAVLTRDFLQVHLRDSKLFFVQKKQVQLELSWKICRMLC